jgi:hypothetical protein
MGDPIAKQRSRQVRGALGRRLRDFYATLTGYFTKDASDILRKVEERAASREPTNRRLPQTEDRNGA